MNRKSVFSSLKKTIASTIFCFLCFLHHWLAGPHGFALFSQTVCHFHVHEGGFLCLKVLKGGHVQLCVSVAFVIWEAGWPPMFSFLLAGKPGARWTRGCFCIALQEANGLFIVVSAALTVSCIHTVWDKSILFLMVGSQWWWPKKASPSPFLMSFVALSRSEPWSWRVAACQIPSAAPFRKNTEWLLTKWSETREVSWLPCLSVGGTKRSSSQFRRLACRLMKVF